MRLTPELDQALADVIHPVETADDPFASFAQWLTAATAAEINDPNAMNLATLDADGRLSSRMVLLKGYDKNGFVFYTNIESHKGRALQRHPLAALCFHWKSLRRQVRIEGIATRVRDVEADTYFATRPYGSQIGAWASQQSRPLADRETMLRKLAELRVLYPEGQVPRPPYWTGICVAPLMIEFWQERLFRLHDRIIFRRDALDAAWIRERYYP